MPVNSLEAFRHIARNIYGISFRLPGLKAVGILPFAVLPAACIFPDYRDTDNVCALRIILVAGYCPAAKCLPITLDLYCNAILRTDAVLVVVIKPGDLYRNLHNLCFTAKVDDESRLFISLNYTCIAFRHIAPYIYVRCRGSRFENIVPVILRSNVSGTDNRIS